MTHLQKYVSNKTKNVNTKLLNMITNKAKTMPKHISCDCKFQIQ